MWNLKNKTNEQTKQKGNQLIDTNCWFHGRGGMELVKIGEGD